MADRRIRRKRARWPWVLLILLIVALIWLIVSPQWYGEKVYEAPPGTDVRDLERDPIPTPDPGSFSEFDQPGEVNRSRPEK